MKAGKLDLRLALISADRETLDGVQQYFERMGAVISCFTQLEDGPSIPSGADAVLLFSDDYPFEHVLRVVFQLRARVVVIVTAEVVRCRDSLRKAGSPANVLVLRRPAWGWKLLEAVRDGQIAEED